MRLLPSNVLLSCEIWMPCQSGARANSLVPTFLHMEGKNCLVNALIIAQFTAKMEMVGRIPDYFPSGAVYQTIFRQGVDLIVGAVICKVVVLLHFMRECALCILQETINYVVMQLLLGYHCAPCVIYDGMLPKTTCALTLSPPPPPPPSLPPSTPDQLYCKPEFDIQSYCVVLCPVPSHDHVPPRWASMPGRKTTQSPQEWGWAGDKRRLYEI